MQNQHEEFAGPVRRTVTFSLPEALFRRLRLHTESKSINTSKLVQRLLEAYLKAEAADAC